MTIDKMELLKRYKELKAQGVEITLMELKKKLDSGVNVVANNLNTSQILDGTGVNAATNTQNHSYSEPDSESINVGSLGAGVNQTNEPSWAERNISGSNPSGSAYTPIKTDFLPAPPPITQPVVPEPDPVKVELQPQLQPRFQVQTQPVFEYPETPAKYALIGYPLGHSLSSFIHEAGFKSLGMDSTYEILETPPDSLVDRIKFLKYNNYAGFNVTIPLKLPVTLFLNDIDVSADIVGAVNTVVINPDKTMKGYNTDVIGFRNAIPSDVTLAGKVAGVLGTGGAARAAITALAQSQVRKIKVYTRNIPNCADLMKFLREKFPLVEFEAFQIERIRDLSDINILVNTTPIGMQGKAADFTPVEENELRTLPQGAVVYDVIYNPKKTVLLKLAQKNGYRTINGVDMFIHQALAAEQIWTGKTPDFKDMKIAALENL